jgi:hypothetical protein
MIRKINSLQNLYLCQSSTWQCIVESSSEEEAATLAIENIMMSEEADKFSLTASIAILKLNNNLFANEDVNEIFEFYSPMILANAGFHQEAQSLEKLLKTEQNEKDIY